MKKRLFVLAVSVLAVLALLCAGASAEDWTCPTCGRVNTDEMNFCGTCRTEKPVERAVMGTNAWVCSTCGQVCPDTDNFCTKCGSDHLDTDENAILFDKPVMTEVTIAPDTIRTIPLHYAGSWEMEYTAEYGGRYYVDMPDKPKWGYMYMRIYDDTGAEIVKHGYNSNTSWFTVNLTAGKTYRFRLSGDVKEGDHTLVIGEPGGPTVEVSARTAIIDSIEYPKQINRYRFTPEVSGEYYIDVMEMKYGQNVDIRVIDELNYVPGEMEYMAMGDGFTCELEAGKTYTIRVMHRIEKGYYKIGLKNPNPVRSLRGNIVIADYMYYKGQKNKYEYTADNTAEYYISSSGGVGFNLYDKNRVSVRFGKDGYKLTGGETYILEADNSYRNVEGYTFTFHEIEPSW